MSSSPDPLNDTATFHHHSKPQRSFKPRSPAPSLQGNSPKKQTFELDVGDRISPHKIKVTVEASNSDVENWKEDDSPLASHVPKNRRRIRTTTTTVPVKGLSDREDDAQNATTPKRGRGRPRKSLGTPVPAKKGGRASTPSRAGNTPRKSASEATGDEDGEEGMLSIGKNVEIGRGKSRSQSRTRRKPPRKSVSTAGVATTDDVALSIAAKKVRRQKSSVVEGVAILEDDHQDFEEVVQLGAAETDGYLLSIDVNTSPGNTTFGNPPSDGDSGHGLIATSSPAKEVSQRTSWSSLRALNPLSPHQQTAVFPTLREEEEMGERSVARTARPANITLNQQEEDGAEVHDFLEDDVGEMVEFDTILESEGFSMISVDSVPSLREHRSSPWSQKGIDEPEKPTRSRIQLQFVDSGTVKGESIRRISVDRQEPMRSLQLSETSRFKRPGSEISLAEKLPENVEPASSRKSHLSNLLSQHILGVDDSFSSIAPDILEAATPGRPVTRPMPTNSTIKHDESHEDSFSAIPSAIMGAAATPAAKRHEKLTEHENPRPSDIDHQKLSVPQIKQNPFSNKSGQDMSPRLLTPEETPSPPYDPPSAVLITQGEPVAQGHSGSVSREQTHHEPSLMYSQMPSSPPIAPGGYTYTAHLRNYRQLRPEAIETPSIVFSSPSLPPPPGQQPQGHIGYSQGLAANRRPTLSPIARTGRVLQDAIVPLSPRSRSQSLGSPFKSPSTSRTSSSAQRDSQLDFSQDTWQKHLPKLALAHKLPSLSSRQSKWTRNNAQDDPFGNNSHVRNHRSPSIEDKEGYSLGLPNKGRLAEHRAGSIRSHVDSMMSENAMIWQAEEEIALDNGTAASMDNLTLEQTLVTKESTVDQQMDPAGGDNAIIIATDSREYAQIYQEHDDEDFDLLLETMGSSSPVSHTQEQSKTQQKYMAEKPRRSKIPSPWRKNSKRLTYSDELSHLSEPATNRPPLLGDMTGSAISKPVTARQVMIEPLSSDPLEYADLSGFQIPQKSNFQPRVRESGGLDLSALLGTSPPKKLPVLSSTTSGNTSSSEYGRQTSPVITAKQASKGIDSQNGVENVHTFTPIPQKMGFTPKARARNSSPVRRDTTNLFGNADPSRPKGSKPSVALFSSRFNIPVSKEPVPEHTRSVGSYDVSSSITSSAEKENQAIDNRTLKWTETVGQASKGSQITHSVSPTKSCLRSPLKTPSASFGSGPESPNKVVAFVSSSPMPDSPLAQPLSATIWSRDHWLLLESIVNAWKEENKKSPGLDSTFYGSKRRHSTKVVSRLLGRNIRCEGENVVLEQWHLEAVDEFRGEVPGWEEKTIALRVFGLIKGGEKRKARESAQLKETN
ncbi:hypothetical protein BJ875DRAFT_453377 [Amylocarpus encephaloides]|uniref:Uncharacterized protein n=1 Tax=Amylocarpus encephaloides TaxID=45428 RepID=A0A9P7YQ22_9HELO|nr:hypothetical protein BJ875DRAFT_453377 [Amylocarpus encephaloides]